MPRRFVPRALRGQLSPRPGTRPRPARRTTGPAPMARDVAADTDEPGTDPTPAAAGHAGAGAGGPDVEAAGSAGSAVESTDAQDSGDGATGSDDAAGPAERPKGRRPSPAPRRRPSPRPHPSDAASDAAASDEVSGDDAVTDDTAGDDTGDDDAPAKRSEAGGRSKTGRPPVKAAALVPRATGGTRRGAAAGTGKGKNGRKQAPGRPGGRAAERARAQARSRARLSRLRVAALVLAIVAVLSTSGAVLTWRLSLAHDAVDPGADATATAQAAGVAILSYDYRTFDTGVRRAEGYAGGGFATQYARSMAGLKKTAVKDKAIVTAKVSSTGVVTAAPDRVVLLLFVDQYRQNSNIDGQKIDQDRVLLTMTHTRTGWKVTKVTAI